MFSVSEICEEISQKIKEVSEEMSHCKWERYAEILDESYSVMQEELARMREQYWKSAKVGTRVRLYSEPHLRDYQSHIVNGMLQLKEEYTELYDPVQECWRDLQSRIYRETFFPLIIEPIRIDDIFFAHLFNALDWPHESPDSWYHLN